MRVTPSATPQRPVHTALRALVLTCALVATTHASASWPVDAASPGRGHAADTSTTARPFGSARTVSLPPLAPARILTPRHRLFFNPARDDVAFAAPPHLLARTLDDTPLWTRYQADAARVLERVDLNHDLRDELLVLTRDARLLIVDAVTGDTRWRSPEALGHILEARVGTARNAVDEPRSLLLITSLRAEDGDGLVTVLEPDDGLASADTLIALDGAAIAAASGSWLTTLEHPTRARLADLDGDGASIELLVERAGELLVYQLDGEAFFLLTSGRAHTEPSSDAHLSELTEARSLLTRDADGDGDLELFIVSSGRDTPHRVERVDLLDAEGAWSIQDAWRFDLSIDAASDRRVLLPASPLTLIDGAQTLTLNAFNHQDDGRWRAYALDVDTGQPSLVLDDRLLIATLQADADPELEALLIEPPIDPDDLSPTTARVSDLSASPTTALVFDDVAPVLMPGPDGHIGRPLLEDDDGDGVPALALYQDRDGDARFDRVALVQLADTSQSLASLGVDWVFVGASPSRERLVFQDTTGRLHALDHRLDSVGNLRVPGALAPHAPLLAADLDADGGALELLLCDPSRGALIALDAAAADLTPRWEQPLGTCDLQLALADLLDTSPGLEIAALISSESAELRLLDASGVELASLTLADAAPSGPHTLTADGDRLYGLYTRSATGEQVAFAWRPQASLTMLDWTADGAALDPDDGRFDPATVGAARLTVAELDATSDGREIAVARGAESARPETLVIELISAEGASLRGLEAPTSGAPIVDLAAADLEGDSTPEIAALTTRALYRFSADGTLRYLAPLEADAHALAVIPDPAGSALLVSTDEARVLFAGDASIGLDACDAANPCVAAELVCAEALARCVDAPRARVDAPPPWAPAACARWEGAAESGWGAFTEGTDGALTFLDIANLDAIDLLPSGAALSRVIAADLDGDGVASPIVATADGRLRVFDAAAPELPRVSELREIALDVSGDPIEPDTDIDQTDDATTLALAWDAVTGATQLELVLSLGGVILAEQTLAGDATTSRFEGLELRPEQRVRSAIRALDPQGRPGPWRRSDGVQLRDLEPPLISDLTLTPSAIQPGVSEALLEATLSDDVALESVQLLLRQEGRRLLGTRAFALSGVTATLSERYTGVDAEGAPLPDGLYPITVIARDRAGASFEAIARLRVDTTPPPPPVITRPEIGSVLGDQQPGFGGSATQAEGGRVEVFRGDVLLCSAVVDRLTSQWSCVSEIVFEEDTHAVFAVAYDAAGNASEPSEERRFRVDTRVPDTPVILSPGPNSVEDEAVVVIVGSAAPNNDVIVFEGDSTETPEVLCEVRSDGAGEFSCSTPPLPDGRYTLFAISTNIAGVTSGASLETTFFVNLDGDTDNDGMSDRWESRYGFDPYDDADAEGDADGDGAPNLAEFFAGTSPVDADSDDDGLCDGDEPGWSTDVDGDGAVAALDIDSDNDGLLDGVEMGLVEPCSLSDTDLTRGRFRPDADPSTTTSMELADSDADGVRDGAEDPNHNGAREAGEADPSDPGTDPARGLFTDDDGDGVTDREEIIAGSDPRDADTDDDGLLDGAEANWSLDDDGDGLINALDVDSDADGLFDGTEVGIIQVAASTDRERRRFIPDADPDTRTSVILRDTDGDSLRDGLEDINANGRLDAGELDPLDPTTNLNAAALQDSDGDGLSDLEESSISSRVPVPAGVVPLLDADSDDDGLIDGLEPNWWDDHDSDGLVQMFDPDSDNDCATDGTERGVTQPHPDTDLEAEAFAPDRDPSTRTLPLSADSDRDGFPEDVEDLNCNGRIDRSLGETDPLDPLDPPQICRTDADCPGAVCIEGVCAQPSGPDMVEPLESEGVIAGGCTCGVLRASSSDRSLAWWLVLLGLVSARWLRSRRAAAGAPGGGSYRRGDG